MLSHFHPPTTVTCILCHGSVSVKKGDKARFKNHISQDHEVHFDMDLIFALSFMSKVEKDTILGIIEPRFNGDVGGGYQAMDKETLVDQNVDDDVEIVDEESDIEEPIVGIPSDLAETASENIPVNDASTACLTCGKMVLNKYLKIHSKIHGKESDLLADKNRVLVSFDEGPDIDKENISNMALISLDESLNMDREADSDLKDDGEDGMVYEKVFNESDPISNEDFFKMNLRHPKQADLVENDKITQCTFCAKQMNKRSIPRHIKRVHKKSKESDSLRKCKICLKNIKSHGFDIHLERMHSGRSEKCKLCYLRFKRKHSYKKHIETIHVNDQDLLNRKISRSECTFSCDMCSLKFITKNVLDYHIDRKHGRGDEQCKFCERRYPNEKSLKAHIGKVHKK